MRLPLAPFALLTLALTFSLASLLTAADRPRVFSVEQLTGSATTVELPPREIPNAPTPPLANSSSAPASSLHPIAPLGDYQLLASGWQISEITRSGAPLSDGTPRPYYPAAISVFPGSTRDELLLLVAHAVPAGSSSAEAFGTSDLPVISADLRYDSESFSGVTRLVLDSATSQPKRQELALLGTSENATGTATPWGSFITAENYLLPQNSPTDTTPAHGSVFEVPAANRGMAAAAALGSFGRMSFGAIAYDPASDVIYFSEDAPAGALYRFTPNIPRDLTHGGRLEVLAVNAWPTADTRNRPDVTRKFAHGRAYTFDWVPLVGLVSGESPAAAAAQVGAARFAHLRAISSLGGRTILASANGGAAESGQLFELQGTSLRLLEDLKADPASSAQSPRSLLLLPSGEIIVGEGKAAHSRLMRRSNTGSWQPLLEAPASAISGIALSPDRRRILFNILSPGILLQLSSPEQL